MDIQREKALDAVEISVSESGSQTVKCQNSRCLLIGKSKLSGPYSNYNKAISSARAKLRTMEKYHKRYGGGITKDQDIREQQQKIAQLEEEAKDARAEKRRTIPLQYWRGRYVCGTCLDKLVRCAR
jgi:hypothetical protein